MITIKRAKKDVPNYGDRKLYSVHGFAIDDCTICLIEEEGLVIWINDDGYIAAVNPNNYNYSCSSFDVTIGEFLEVVEGIDSSRISAIFTEEKDFKITFEYMIEHWIK